MLDLPSTSYDHDLRVLIYQVQFLNLLVDLFLKLLIDAAPVNPKIPEAESSCDNNRVLDRAWQVFRKTLRVRTAR